MLKTDENCIAVAIYTHAELYPPLLNAIDELSDVFRTVLVVSRNVKESHWKYPAAVEYLASGQFISIRDSEQRSLSWKLRSFVQFTFDFYKNLKRGKPTWVMCNDAITLMAIRIIRPLLGFKIKLWYHNHDVVELKKLRSFSVGYFAQKLEGKYFRMIDLFTLPAEARLKYFPIAKLKGRWMIVPNYPSLRRMDHLIGAHWDTMLNLKLIYQGQVSDEHGLEEIIDHIKTDSRLKLTVIGPGEEVYIQSLKRKADELGVGDQVAILNPVSYAALGEITLNHQVGLAVNKPVNILYQTAALASNKIYEYAAGGLPVLYYGNEHYTESLGKFSWAFPTDLSAINLSDTLQIIREKYDSLSQAAYLDFKNKLNFGINFTQVLHFLKGQSGLNK